VQRNIISKILNIIGGPPIYSIHVCVTDIQETKMAAIMDVFDEFHAQLITSLPMRDAIFLAKLTQKGLMCSQLKARVKSMPTEEQGARLFLDSIMKVSLGYATSFEKLLSAMEEFKMFKLAASGQ